MGDPKNPTKDSKSHINLANLIPLYRNILYIYKIIFKIFNVLYIPGIDSFQPEFRKWMRGGLRFAYTGSF